MPKLCGWGRQNFCLWGSFYSIHLFLRTATYGREKVLWEFLCRDAYSWVKGREALEIVLVNHLCRLILRFNSTDFLWSQKAKRVVATTKCIMKTHTLKSSQIIFHPQSPKLCTVPIIIYFYTKQAGKQHRWISQDNFLWKMFKIQHYWEAQKWNPGEPR